MIGVLDYGQGNLYNARNGLRRAGAKRVKVVETRSEIDKCSALVIPGVGSFSEAMKKLEPLRSCLREFVGEGKPLLGICLGMQVLFEEGEEGGKTVGLGLLAGSVRKLRGASKLPHIGWNSVLSNKRAGVPESLLWKGLPENPFFYFVHSYAGVPVEESVIIGRTEYGKKFVSAVQRRNVFGVQFHPEKSGKNGEKVLANFVELTEKWK